MIQAKPKPCSGIGKAKGVKGCKKETPYRTFGLCASCLSDFIFSTDAGKLIFEKRIIPKAKAKVKAEQRVKDGLTREKLKTKSEWEADLQKQINQIVKHIDKGWGCIATNTLQGKRNAGHYFSVGSNPTLRFHLENIWNQSEHSNSYKSGDTLRYRDGMVRLYSQEYLSRLDALKMIQPIKLTIDELKDKIRIARKIVAELKEADRIYTLSERIELRQIFNERIGIYPDCELTPKISKKAG